MSSSLGGKRLRESVESGGASGRRVINPTLAAYILNTPSGALPNAQALINEPGGNGVLSLLRNEKNTDCKVLVSPYPTAGGGYGAIPVTTINVAVSPNVTQLSWIEPGTTGQVLQMGVGGAPRWGSNGASSDATFVVNVPEASVPNAQALSDLTTGLMVCTTATGIVSSIPIGSNGYVLTVSGGAMVWSSQSSSPQNGTFIVQVPHAQLPEAQPLSVLASGYMRSTTATGVITTVAVPIPISDGGTGSTTQNFVDLASIQTVNGIKSWGAPAEFTSTGAVAISLTGEPLAQGSSALLRVGNGFANGSPLGSYVGIGAPGVPTGRHLLSCTTNGLNVARMTDSGDFYTNGRFYGPLTGDVTGNCSGTSANVTGIVAIANGGTGSATQNFVDLTTNQANIGGNKTFTGLTTFSLTSGPAFQCTGVPATSISSSLIRVGSVISPGSGAAGGTYISTNAPAASTADFLHMQANGTTVMKLNSEGRMECRGRFECKRGTISNGLYVNDSIAADPIVSLALLGTATLSGGNANGTLLGMNNTQSTTDSILVQSSGSTVLRLTATGTLTVAQPISGSVTGTAANVTDIVAIANGGTGSATQNFVDLTTAQSITSGKKTFSTSGVMAMEFTGAAPVADALVKIGSGTLTAPANCLLAVTSALVAATAEIFTVQRNGTVLFSVSQSTTTFGSANNSFTNVCSFSNLITSSKTGGRAFTLSGTPLVSATATSTFVGFGGSASSTAAGGTWISIGAAAATADFLNFSNTASGCVFRVDANGAATLGAPLPVASGGTGLTSLSTFLDTSGSAQTKSGRFTLSLTSGNALNVSGAPLAIPTSIGVLANIGPTLASSGFNSSNGTFLTISNRGLVGNTADMLLVGGLEGTFAALKVDYAGKVTIGAEALMPGVPVTSTGAALLQVGSAFSNGSSVGNFIGIGASGPAVGRYLLTGSTNGSRVFSIDDGGVITSPVFVGNVTGNVSGTSANITGIASTSNGGTGYATYATGDILFASATVTLSKRSIGSTSQVLTVSGGVPIWADNLGGQIVETSISTYSELATSIISMDDTIPQQSEGDEIITCSVTPKSASSYLTLNFEACGYMDPNSFIFSFFRDATADAIKSSVYQQHTATTWFNHTMSVRVASASTSSTTFKVRVGAAVGVGAVNISFNGIFFLGTGRRLGGSLKMTLRITESN